MLQQKQEKLALSAALRRAIEGNELEIVFQPEILLRDGSIIGMEALTRWHSTQHGEVSPDRFIPVAEETGLILSLGEWVLRNACRRCVELQRQTGRMLRLAAIGRASCRERVCQSV